MLSYGYSDADGWDVLTALAPAAGRFLRRRAGIILLTLFLLVAAGLVPLAAGTAAANGRAILIASPEQGPYRVEVNILPNRAVVNNTHLSVRIAELSSAAALTAARVRVSATGPADAAERPAAWGPLAADNDVLPEFFEATLPFSVPGNWQMRISVATELGQETVEVPVLLHFAGGGGLLTLAGFSRRPLVAFPRLPPGTGHRPVTAKGFLGRLAVNFLLRPFQHSPLGHIRAALTHLRTPF